MHLGNAWTALLAWLSARSKGGAVVLRMEDLDPDRSKEHFARAILDDLGWLGLDWDEGPDKGGPHPPYRQSQRRGYYQRCLERLSGRGLIYPCWCTRAELRAGASRNAPGHADPVRAPHAGEAEPVYAGTCLRLCPDARAVRETGGRRPSLRVRATPERIGFTDLALGPKSQHLLAECGDFVLQRSDGVHAYQLAVVADDADQRITEVVRGADLLDSTARQIYLYRMLGFAPPAFAHVPLLVDPDGRRLSKRRGDVDLGQLRDRGVAPEIVTGYLAYRAGLIDAPRAVAAHELVAGFHFGGLAAGPVVVEENWLESMR
jgi:glutamyl-tRNA synthetase